MNVSHVNSLVDTSIMSNEQSLGTGAAENQLAKFWQNNTYNNAMSSSIQLTGNSSLLLLGTQIAQSDLGKHGGHQMNVNAPSYTPYNYGYNLILDKNIGHSPELYDRSSLHNFALNKRDETQEELERVKVDLMLKNQMIKSLSSQLNSFNKAKTRKNAPTAFKVPRNYYELFKDLSASLQEKQKELEETKLRLEAIVVALAMNPLSSVTSGGQFDEQDLAHKIVTKLAYLQSENEDLLRMMSSSNQLSLLVELGLLRTEVSVLKEKLQSNKK